MSAASQQAAPDYTYWYSALAGNFGEVHDGDAQPGFWRRRSRRAGPFDPVAIWHDGTKLVALVGDTPVDAGDVWSYCCRFPVTKAQYDNRLKTGMWHDDDPAVVESLAHGASNSAAVDEADILKEEIETAAAGVSAYVKIRDDATAAKAQALRSRLLELSGKADKTRENQKKPHLEAGKVIDSKWTPLVKLSKVAADTIRAALGAHETRKANELAAAEKIKEEARIKAERERVKAAAAGRPVPAPIPEPPAPPMPVASTTIRGGSGRGAAVRVVKKATVVDQDRAYLSMRLHPELVELIAKLAQRAATAGVPVDGVEVTEERVVS